MANYESSDSFSGARESLKSLSHCRTVRDVPKIYTQEDETFTEDKVYQPDQESCKDIPVCGEVVVTTDSETSISAVISSSLQAVNGDCETEFDGPNGEIDDGVTSETNELADGYGNRDKSWAEPSEEFCIENNEQSISTHEQDSLPPSVKGTVTEAAGDSNGSVASDAISSTMCNIDAEKGCCDLVSRNTQSSEDEGLFHKEPTSASPPSNRQSAFIQPSPSTSPSQVHTFTPLRPSQNSNNSNSCDPAARVPPMTPPVAIAMSGIEPPRKRAKMMKHGQIEITLEGKSLWDEFYRRGTEMIVNRIGRRMFPGFAVALSGLKPKAKYTMKIEVVLADNHRFKFLNGRWLAVGNAEPQSLSETYLHPDSPNSGAFWMRHGVSFRKLKITNNKERPGTSALLHSMHKYYLRLLIDEEFKTPPGGEKIPAKNILQMDFPETSFIAVTAYQNEEVTQLKITNNPFAKAFRENASEMDWEVLYHQNGMYSPLSQHPEMYGNHLVPPGSWPLQSPMLPPTPLSSTLPPYSPLPGVSPNQGGMNYHTPGQFLYSSTMTPTAYQGASGSMPGSASYFQWPQISGQYRKSTTGPSVPSQPLPCSMVAPTTLPSGQMQHQNTYEQFQPTHHYGSASLHPSTVQHHGNSTLPDFDSAFTPAI